MKAEGYDEAKALDEYVMHNFSTLMTDLERRAYTLAQQREKAKHSSVAAERLPKWTAAAGADAEAMSQGEVQVAAARIRQRIQNDSRDGQIVINRCPNCSRIVKTPRSRQCLWCGHDWHG